MKIADNPDAGQFGQEFSVSEKTGFAAGSVIGQVNAFIADNINLNAVGCNIIFNNFGVKYRQFAVDCLKFGNGFGRIGASAQQRTDFFPQGFVIRNMLQAPVIKNINAIGIQQGDINAFQR